MKGLSHRESIATDFPVESTAEASSLSIKERDERGLSARLSHVLSNDAAAAAAPSSVDQYTLLVPLCTMAIAYVTRRLHDLHKLLQLG